MCGIAGVVRYENNAITEDEVASLGCAIEWRGTHATGLCVMNGADIWVHKMAKPAWAFFSQKATKEFMHRFLPDAKIVLIHTRFATLGNPNDNDNNHPMFAGKCAVIHNGSISNHDHIMRANKWERSAETDSDIFRAIFDEHGFTPRAFQLCNSLYGSAAIAAVSPDRPDTLLLARSGNPVNYGTHAGKFYFASTLKALHKSVHDWKKGPFGLWVRHHASDFEWAVMQDNTLYVMDTHAEGEAEHHPFKVCTNFVGATYTNHDRHAERMEAFRKQENKNFGVCPKCGVTYEKKPTQRWKDLKCADDKCGASLACYEGN